MELGIWESQHGRSGAAPAGWERGLLSRAEMGADRAACTRQGTLESPSGWPRLQTVSHPVLGFCCAGQTVEAELFLLVTTFGCLKTNSSSSGASLGLGWSLLWRCLPLLVDQAGLAVFKVCC